MQTHLICRPLWVWENNDHLKIRSTGFPSSVPGLQKLQSMPRRWRIGNHHLFPSIKYLPFAPTRSFYTCKSSCAGESLSTDSKIIIVKSVKRPGRSLTMGFKPGEVFIHRNIFLTNFSAIYISSSVLDDWTDTNHSTRQHIRDERSFQGFFFRIRYYIFTNNIFFPFYKKQWAWW